MALFGRGVTPIPLLAVAILLSGWVAYIVYMPQPSNDPYRLKPDDAMVVQKGQGIYTKHCASCHGVDLAGEPDWKTPKMSGRLPAPPHNESGHSWHHDTASLFNVTKYGPQYVAGDKYESDMPAFEKTLSDDEILAVLSYIKSTWPEKIRATHDEINKRASAH